MVKINKADYVEKFTILYCLIKYIYGTGCIQIYVNTKNILIGNV